MNTRPGRARQRGEDLELDERRRDRVAVAHDGALGRVDAQAADLDRLLVVGLRVGHAGAPQRGLHARAELAHRERLGDVVVGAELEPEHLVDLLRLGGEHDDRHGRALARAGACRPRGRPSAAASGRARRGRTAARRSARAPRGRRTPARPRSRRAAAGTTAASGSAARRRRAGCGGRGRPCWLCVEDSVRRAVPSSGVLDVRVYRAAFLPALVALFVAAFSLADRPAAAASPLAADAFDAARAFGGSAPLRNSLARAGGARSRTGSPGSADDARARRPRRGRRSAPSTGRDRPAFRVSRAHDAATSRPSSACGPGLSSRRIVVRRAPRLARRARACAELSGTAAMLELARVFRARELRKTLVLVSTSGAHRRASRARARGPSSAAGGAGRRRDRARRPGRHATRRAVGRAVVARRRAGAARRCSARSRPRCAREVGRARRQPRDRPSGSRRALPFTVSEQGVIADAGAAGRAASASRASAARGRASRCGAAASASFGRAALRAVSAIDAAGPAQTTARAPRRRSPTARTGIVTMRNVLPDWAVRLLVGTLLLPGAADRARRLLPRPPPAARRRRRGWCGSAPSRCRSLLAWLWVRAARRHRRARAARRADARRCRRSSAPARWRSARSRSCSRSAGSACGRCCCARAGRRGEPGGGRRSRPRPARCCARSTALVWVVNPYAAALLLPAAHLWLFAAAPEHAPARLGGAAARRRSGCCRSRRGALLRARAGARPARAGLDGARCRRRPGSSRSASRSSRRRCSPASPRLLVGACARAGRVAAHAEPEPLVTRGPATYAGPGSLGGTESALRR